MTTRFYVPRSIREVKEALMLGGFWHPDMNSWSEYHIYREFYRMRNSQLKKIKAWEEKYILEGR